MLLFVLQQGRVLCKLFTFFLFHDKLSNDWVIVANFAVLCSNLKECNINYISCCGFNVHLCWWRWSLIALKMANLKTPLVSNMICCKLLCLLGLCLFYIRLIVFFNWHWVFMISFSNALCLILNDTLSIISKLFAYQLIASLLS